jgi:hypothetical protein
MIPSIAQPAFGVRDSRCSVSSVRAIRYRRLALAQQDKAIAELLLKLADECDRGILCTAQWHSALPSRGHVNPSEAGGIDPQTPRQGRS